MTTLTRAIVQLGLVAFALLTVWGCWLYVRVVILVRKIDPHLYEEWRGPSSWRGGPNPRKVRQFMDSGATLGSPELAATIARYRIVSGIANGIGFVYIVAFIMYVLYGVFLER